MFLGPESLEMQIVTTTINNHQSQCAPAGVGLASEATHVLCSTECLRFLSLSRLEITIDEKIWE